MRRNIAIYYRMLTLLTAVFAASCAEDSTDNGNMDGRMVAVDMVIGTRATGIPEAAQADVEKIHTWWVAFVDKSGIVRHVESRPSSLTSYVEEERVEMNVPTGKYTIYAFANIIQEELKQEKGIEFIKADNGVIVVKETSESVAMTA